ncbi:MAG: Rpp14/Pop5 family protein [Candidatus Saliniplasma sp.]
MAVNKHRKRYIAFVIEGGNTSRKDMISAIRKNCPRDVYQRYKPWLTFFDGKKGIVRCWHTGKEKLVDMLNTIEVGGGKVKTVTTSGTIKKAKKRLLEDG